MGYIVNHTIIVEGFEEKHMLEARGIACSIFAKHDLHGLVSGIYPHAINGTMSFMIAPDGSKEGWDVSDQGDKARDEFIAWLIGARTRKDNRRYLDWVEIVCPEDEPPHIGRHTIKDDDQ